MKLKCICDKNCEQTKTDKLLLDVFYHATAFDKNIMDTLNLNEFNKAADYLEKKGYITKLNERTYKLKNGN